MEYDCGNSITFDFEPNEITSGSKSKEKLSPQRTSIFQIEWNMILVTVLLSVLNQMKLHLVQNRRETCHHDHISI